MAIVIAIEYIFTAKMNAHISSIGTVIGDTGDGRAWALKALNPADASVECRGIPDKSAIPSVMINYQSTARIAYAGGDDLWNFTGQILPHPVNFGWWTNTDTAGTAVGTFNAMMNQQIAGATHAEKVATFLQSVERYRVAYCSATVHFDGSSMANQGSIVVAQTPYAPRIFNVCYTTAGGITYGKLPVCVNDGTAGQLSTDFPNYDKAVSMPNCYTGAIKDGAYIPLKLTKTCQQWHSDSDCVSWAGNTSATDTGVVIPVAATPNLSYPHPGLATTSQTASERTMPMCNDVIANISGRNISRTAALIVTFRFGIEAQVEPGTVLSPYQMVSPMYDPAALKSYFLIARELKDAYPSDYNDLGKLWNVISSIIRDPTLHTVLTTIHPGLGAAARVGAGVVGGAEAVFRAVKNRRQAIAASEKASATERERSRTAVTAALSRPAGYRPPLPPRPKLKQN